MKQTIMDVQLIGYSSTVPNIGLDVDTRFFINKYVRDAGTAAEQ
jgi:hypothetical protein